MRVVIQAASQPRVRALVRGIEAAGDEPVTIAWAATADVAVCQWWGGARTLYELGFKRVLVCELGYLGDRHREWSSLAWDGLAGRGIHVEGPERPPPPLEPWRINMDGYALILGQVPTDWAVRLALKSTRYEAWLEATKRRLEDYGYTVRYRKHPEVAALDPHPPSSPRERWRRQPPPKRPTLREELEGARLAVTLNSTAAIEAVCMGVPTVTLDRRGCMAGPVSAEFGGLWLDQEPPHRRAWVNRLARLQWSKAELEDGTAWRAMKGAL